MAERQINIPEGFEIEEPTMSIPAGFEIEPELGVMPGQQKDRAKQLRLLRESLQPEDRKTMWEAVQHGWRQAGVNAVKGLAGLARLEAEVGGRFRQEMWERSIFGKKPEYLKKMEGGLKEWSHTMISGVEEYYRQRPQEAVQLDEDAGYLATVWDVVSHPEKLLQLQVEAVPLIAEAMLGTVVAGPVGGIVVMAQPFVGTTYVDARAEGTDPMPAFFQSALTGYGEAAIEQWTFSKKLGLAKNITKIVRKGIGKVLWEGVKLFARGTFEEGTQKFNENLWNWVFTDRSQILTEGVVQAMGIGGPLEVTSGGGFAGVGAAAGQVSNSEKVKRVEALKSKVEESSIPEDGKNELYAEFEKIVQDISEGRFDAGAIETVTGKDAYGKFYQALGKREAATRITENVFAELSEVKANPIQINNKFWQETYDKLILSKKQVIDKMIDSLIAANISPKEKGLLLSSQYEMAAMDDIDSGGVAKLISIEHLANEAIRIDPAPIQALPSAQQDAADTLKQFKADAVTRSQELQQLEYDELLVMAQDGDELAAWRIQEIEAENALEAGLPKFEVLFGEMLEGNEAAKDALYNGEYQGGRSRQQALEAAPTAEEDTLRKVYSKGFVAKLTSIRNNADNIVAGAGDKAVQVKVMKSDLAKVQEHYDNISEDIKNNPELLAELGEIEKLLPKYAAAVNSFAASPSNEGFGQIKTVGDQIAELGSKYSERLSLARVDPTIPATDEQVRNFATIKVHALARLMGVNKTDRQRIQQDIVGKKSMKDMDLEESKRVEAYFVAEAKKRGLTTSTGKELADVIKQYTTQKKVQELSGTKPVAWKKMLQTPGRIVNQFFHQTKRVERLLEALDGFTEGPIYNSIWTSVHTALVGSRTSYGNRVGKFKEALVDIMTPELNTEEGIAGAIETIQAEETKEGKKARKLGKRAVRKLVGDSLWARYITSGKEVILEPTDTNPGLTLTASERIGMYLAMKNEDSRAHLFAGNLAEFDNPALAALEVAQRMSTQEKQIGDWILADLEANFDRANQAAVIGLGRKLDQQDNYFPISIIDTAELQTQDFLSLLEDKYTKQTFKTEPAETKERIAGAEQPLDLDSFGVYLGHMKRIEQFIHMAPVAKSVGNILNTREFRQAVNNKTSGHGAGILDRWLKNAVRGHAIDSQTGLAAKTMLWMRQKGVLFSLARNVPSVVRQFISGFNTAATHPTILAYAAGNIAKSVDPRYYRQLESRMRELSPEMETRSFERYFANVKQQAKAAGLLTGRKEFSEKALGWQKWADRRTVVTSWNAFYDSARQSEAVQKQFELDGSDEAAVAFANKMIARTQPMGDVEHLPDFFVGGPIERLLSTFQNQVNNNWNFWAHDIYGMRKAGKISRKMVMYRVLFSNILPSMMFGAISRGGLPDDWKDVLFDWAAYSISPIFLLGRLAVDAVLGFAGGQTSVEDILPSTASKTIGAAIREDPGKVALYGLKTVGGLTGRIPNQAIRTGQGIHDIVTGETDDLRRLIYSDWSLTKYGWPGGGEEETGFSQR